MHSQEKEKIDFILEHKSKLLETLIHEELWKQAGRLLELLKNKNPSLSISSVNIEAEARKSLYDELLINPETMRSARILCIAQLIHKDYYPDTPLDQIIKCTVKTQWLTEIRELENKEFAEMNMHFRQQDTYRPHLVYEQVIQKNIDPTFVLNEQALQEIAYSQILHNFYKIWADGALQFFQQTLLPQYHEFQKLCTEKNIPLSALHRAYQQVYKHKEAVNLRDKELELFWELHTKCDIPFVRDTKNIGIILQDKYEETMKKTGYKSRGMFGGRERHISFGKIDEVNQIITMAHNFGVELALSSRATLEDAYIRKLTTPVRITPQEIDPRYDLDEGREDFVLTIPNLEKELQNNGSELSSEDVVTMDIREYFAINPQRRYDLSQEIIWQADQSPAHVVIHANRSENGETFEGNYLMMTDHHGKIYLIRDSMAHNHYFILEKLHA